VGSGVFRSNIAFNYRCSHIPRFPLLGRGHIPRFPSLGRDFVNLYPPALHYAKRILSICTALRHGPKLNNAFTHTNPPPRPPLPSPLAAPPHLLLRPPTSPCSSLPSPTHPSAILPWQHAPPPTCQPYSRLKPPNMTDIPPPPPPCSRNSPPLPPPPPARLSSPVALVSETIALPSEPISLPSDPYLTRPRPYLTTSGNH
jgi:hypothetical protein